MKKFYFVLVVMFLISVSSVLSENVPYLTGTFLNQDPDPVSPGGFVDVRWKIENSGDTTASNVIAVIEPEFPFSLYNTENNTQSVGILLPKQDVLETPVVKYRLRVDPNAVEGNNDIKIKFSPDGGKSFIELISTITVTTSDSAVSVDSVVSNPEVIEPGTNATLKVKIRNTADTVLKEVSVRVDPTLYSLLSGSAPSATTSVDVTNFVPVSPIGSSFEKKIKSLASNEVNEFIFNFVADPSAESKVYKLPLIVTFKDTSNTEYNKTHIISLVINHAPELLVTSETKTTLIKGRANTFTLVLSNKGVSDAKFVTVTLLDSEDYMIFSPKTLYIGKIDSDDYESADYQVFFNSFESETASFPVNIKYKDAINKEYEINETVTLKAFTSQEAENYGLIQRTNYTGMLIVFVILVLGIVLYRYFKKKRK